MNERDPAELERRTKELFDDSASGLDAATRSRLTQARHRALEALGRPERPVWGGAWVPAGTLAAAALVAWFTFWQTPRVPDESLQAVSLVDLEIMLAEEDLELLDEELEFYGWLEEQPEFSAADDNVG